MPLRATVRAALVLLLAWVALPSPASAGGFDLAPIGTRPLGRGGAYAARADDGMAMFYNPAMLADLPDFVQLQLSGGLGIWDACVARSGTYGESFDEVTQPTVFGEGNPGWFSAAYPRVCNSGDPQFIPSLTATFRLAPEVTLALGIWTPGGVGQARFGSPDGSVAVGTERAPAPTRYMLLERNLLLFAPSVGVGWRPVEWFRVGFTFQWGIAVADFTNYTSVGGTGEDPSNDIRTRLQAVDAFVPAGILSVHFVPHENLDIMLGGRISDSVGGVADASGSLTLTTGAFGTSTAGSTVPRENVVNGSTLQAGQPFTFTLAARYADRIRRRAYTHGPLGDVLPQVDDPMWGENFDIELDITFVQLSQVGDFVITNAPGANATLERVGNTPLTVPIPRTLPLPHGWSDALRFAVGGDVNIIPGTFAVRAGASFELPLNYDFVRYAQNDFMQGWNLGLALGATVRIERFDISAAYMHTFAETINVTNANYRAVSATGSDGVCTLPNPMPPPDTIPDPTYDPARPVVSRGCYPNGFGGAVNAGSYTQDFNVFSLALAYHFD